MFSPFISVTDFMERCQVEAMRDVFIEAGGISIGRRLGVGVMTSYKMANGLHSKWNKAFPHIKKIAEIFVRDPALINVLHYADYRSVDVAASLELATKYGGENMEALQLDMLWPEASIVRAYHVRHPDIQIILQVGKDAMAELSYDPFAVAAKLREYASCIDAVLLDKSMGRGVAMNPTELLKYAFAIHSQLPACSLVVAGGLGPNSLSNLKPIIASYPDVSIDAQGQLRSSGSALDPIDWDIATTYLCRAIEMFQR